MMGSGMKDLAVVVRRTERGCHRLIARAQRQCFDVDDTSETRGIFAARNVHERFV